jgi:hypothetical protein
MNNENHAQITTSTSHCPQQNNQCSYPRDSCKSNKDSSVTIFEPVERVKRQPEVDLKRFRAMTMPAKLEEVRARQEERWAEDKVRDAKILAMFGIEFVA